MQLRTCFLLLLFALDTSHHPEDRFERFRSRRLDFRPFEERLAPVGHIVNAIALQTGLINKQIPVDEVIRELMFLRDTRLEDISVANAVLVGEATKALEQLVNEHDLLLLGAQVERTENELIEFAELRKELDAYGDINKAFAMKNLVRFFQDLKKIDFDPLDKLKKSIDQLILILERAHRTTSVAPTKKYKEAVGEWFTYSKPLDDLRRCYEDFEKATAEVVTFSEALPSHDTFYSHLQVFKDQKKAVLDLLHRIRLYRTYQYNMDYWKLKPEANAEVLRKVAPKFHAAKKGLKVIRDILQAASHSTRPKIDRNHTAAFINGFQDLAALRDNLDDEAACTMLNEGHSMGKLAAGLKPLDVFVEKLRVLYRRWQPLNSHFVVDVFEKVDAIRRLMDELTGPKIEVVETVDALKRCIDATKYAYNQEFDELLANITHVLFEYDINVGMIKELALFAKARFEEIPKMIQTLKLDDIKETVSFSEVHEAWERIPFLYQRLRSLDIRPQYDELFEFRAHLDSADLRLRSDHTYEKSVQRQLEILLNMDALYSHVLRNMSQTGIDKFHKCLARDTPEAVTAAMRVSREVRRMQKERNYRFFDDVALALDTVASSGGLIDDIRRFVDEQMGPTPVEMRDFEDLSKWPRLSLHFSTSVAVVVNYMTAWRRRSDVDRLVEHIDAPQKLIDKVVDRELKRSIESLWGDFAVEKGRIERTRDDMHRRRGMMVSTPLYTLPDVQLFIDIIAKSGQLDFGVVSDKLKGLDLLTDTIHNRSLGGTGQLWHVRNSLRNIERLELDFAKYHESFTALPNVLDTLVSDFRHFFDAGAHGAPEEQLEDEEEWYGVHKEGTDPFVFFIFIVIVWGSPCVVLCFCVANGMYWFERFEDDSEVDAGDDDASLSDDSCRSIIYVENKEFVRRRLNVSVVDVQVYPYLFPLTQTWRLFAEGDRGKRLSAMKWMVNNRYRIKVMFDGVMSTPTTHVDLFYSQILASLANVAANNTSTASDQNPGKCRHAPGTRLPTRCLDANIVKIYDGRFVHANTVAYPIVGKDIVTQAPLAETIEDFLEMAWESDARNIVMLCDFFETDDAGKGEPVEKCARYFSDEVDGVLEFGPYKVTLLEKRDYKPGQIVMRKLRVSKRFCEGRVFEHYQFIGWPPNTSPKTRAFRDAIRDYRKDNGRKPYSTIVHSSAGTGRAMVFVGSEYAAQAVYNNENITLDEIVGELRMKRDGAIQNGEQLMLLQVLTLDILLMDNTFHIAFLELAEEQFEIVQNFLNPAFEKKQVALLTEHLKKFATNRSKSSRKSSKTQKTETSGKTPTSATTPTSTKKPTSEKQSKSEKQSTSEKTEESVKKEEKKTIAM